MKLCFISKLFCLSLIVNTALAQHSKYIVTSYGIEQGLSQNSAYAIAETDNGLLWIATNDGLNSFDGKTFKAFTVKTDDKVARSPTISNLVLWHHQLLILGTTSETLIFDAQTSKFHKLASFGINIPDKITAKKILIDSHLGVWIITSDNGLYYYNYQHKTTQHFFTENNIKNTLKDITVTSNGSIYLATNNSLFSFNKTWHKLAWLQFEYLAGHVIKSIACKNNKQLYLILDSGVGIVTLGSNNKVDHFQTLSDLPKDINVILQHKQNVWLGGRSTSLNLYHEIHNVPTLQPISDPAGRFVLCIFEDKKGNIWVGYSGAGIQKYQPNQPLFIKVIPHTINQRYDGMVLSINSPDEQNFYMGTLYGGLLHYNINQKGLNYFYNPSLSTDNRNIYGTYIENHQIYMATWAGLCIFNTISKQTQLISSTNSLKLYSVINLSNSPYLLLSGETGLFYYNKLKKTLENPVWLGKQKLPMLVARYMKQMNEDEIYMCTTNENFVVYNLKNNTFKNFEAFKKLALSATHFYIDSLHLFISTNGGLIQCNPKNFQLDKTWTVNEGLSNNYIYSVTKDKNSDIWLSSNGGLSQIEHNTQKIYNYSQKDGIQNQEYNTSSIFITKDKCKLYFGGIAGFNIIDINKLKRHQNNIKPIITQIKINNENYITDTTISYKQLLKLSHNQNFISFDFIAPNASFLEDVSYKYKLVGLDTDWVDAGKRRFASYNSLLAGHYHFLVKSYDSFGKISETNANLHLIISEVWWKTWYAICLSLIILATFMYYFVRYLWLYERNKNQMNMRLSEVELQSLHANISPHFIFNTLNSIYSMVLLNEPQAGVQLNKFATYLRATLELSQHPLSNMKACLEQLKSYLNLQKLRQDALQFEIKIDPNLHIPHLVFPSNTLQLILEQLLLPKLDMSETDIKLLIYVRKVNESLATVQFWGNNIKLHEPQLMNNTTANLELIHRKLSLLEQKYGIKLHLILYQKHETMYENLTLMGKLLFK